MGDRLEKDDGLGEIFAAMRAESAPVPDRLERRVLADAMRVQAGFANAGTAGSGRWHDLYAILGGWRGLGGLVTACAAGVWIGLSPPSFLPDPVSLVAPAASESLGLFGEDELSEFLTEDG